MKGSESFDVAQEVRLCQCLDTGTVCIQNYNLSSHKTVSFIGYPYLQGFFI